MFSRKKEKILQSGQCVGGDRACKEDVSAADHRVLYGKLNGSGSVLDVLYFLCVDVFLATRENRKFRQRRRHELSIESIIISISCPINCAPSAKKSVPGNVSDKKQLPNKQRN